MEDEGGRIAASSCTVTHSLPPAWPRIGILWNCEEAPFVCIRPCLFAQPRTAEHGATVIVHNGHVTGIFFSPRSRTVPIIVRRGAEEALDGGSAREDCPVCWDINGGGQLFYNDSDYPPSISTTLSSLSLGLPGQQSEFNS